MNDVLPGGSREEPGLPVSGVAVLAGVLAAFGAFALLISIIAAFANGAHSHQVLSAATWKQLGTGGGIVAGIALFLSWGTGGFIAARMAGRDGVRHGVWVFIVGVVLITVVGAAITWLPDTTAILRNLRLLGLPVRRNEWRDVVSVAGLASLIGCAAGATAGGWWAFRERAAAPAAAPTAAPAAAPPPPPPLPPEPEDVDEEAAPARAPVAPSLFEPQSEPTSEAPATPEPAEPAMPETPAWLQFIQERERTIQERDRESGFEAAPSTPSTTPVPSPAPEPAPWVASEPAPTFIEEPERQEPQAAEVTSWWPDEEHAEPAAEAASAYDDAWALPDDEGAPVAASEPEDAAFPHPPTIPVPEPAPEEIVVPPLAEHADWNEQSDLYRAPPEPVAEQAVQDAPEAPPPPPDIDPEEREERRRQQEEAARAYEQAREDQ